MKIEHSVTDASSHHGELTHKTLQTRVLNKSLHIRAQGHRRAQNQVPRKRSVASVPVQTFGRAGHRTECAHSTRTREEPPSEGGSCVGGAYI